MRKYRYYLYETKIFDGSNKYYIVDMMISKYSSYVRFQELFNGVICCHTYGVSLSSTCILGFNSLERLPDLLRKYFPHLAI